MRQEINIALVTRSNRFVGSKVVVQYVGTTIEQTFHYPDTLNLAEALALAAVDLRINGLPQGVVDTREPVADHLQRPVYEQI